MRKDLAFKFPGSILAGEKIEHPSILRAKICLCLLLIGFVSVAVKLVVIQVIRHDFWVRYVDEQRKTAITIYPKRGTIYDRNRTPLATSVVQEVLCVAPTHVTDVAKLAESLSPYALMTPKEIIQRIRGTELFLVYLRRGLDVETAKKISEMKISGVEFRSESSRHYPKGVLASNLIGIANMENRGIEGVEFKFDSELAGEAGKQIIIKDNSRREIVALAHTVKQARDGNNLVLTMDEVIQYITEKALEEVMSSFSPEGASAVVINPKTGEVLAMACRPTFEPDKPATYRSERLRNRVITDAFEPGSSFKPVSVSAALEHHVVSAETLVYCELGAMRYHGHTFNDVHPMGMITFADVIAQSSNIGTIKVVSLVQPEWLYGSIRNFGFGEPTDIDLPGESPGIVHPPSTWSGLSMGSIPIGQEISVTALQLAVAFSTIANNGVMMKPHVVSTVADPDGKTLMQTFPQAVRRVLQPGTAKTLREMLERVVTSGTGTAAKVPGYRCAGKTGTAQKANPSGGGYQRGKYTAVFAGFVPAEDPVACIVVVADCPQGKYYGGSVSAPAFKQIAAGILNYLEIPPSMSEEQIAVKPNKKAVKPPIARKPGQKERIDSEKPGDDFPHMPDVRGMTMKAALRSLSVYSLCPEFEGSGIAVSQNPAPRTKIEAGRKCQVAFKRRDTQ